MSRPPVLALADLKPQDMAERLRADYDVVHDIDVAGDAEIVLTAGNIGLSATQMAKLPRLRLIAVNGVGVDAVDLTEAQRRGIAATTTPDVLSLAVAEMALALALACGRRIAEGDRFLRAGTWAAGAKLALGSSVLERRAGILGYGRIGRRLADLLRGMGMQVFYTARAEKPGAPDTFRPDARQLARDCDVLFVTAAGGAGTRGLVDADVLAALGSEGIVVNVARGPVVDAETLARALSERVIAGAGLDVFDDEPCVPRALLDAPNCVLTPHVGSATAEARRAMAQLVLDNIPPMSPAGRCRRHTRHDHALSLHRRAAGRILGVSGCALDLRPARGRRHVEHRDPSCAAKRAGSGPLSVLPGRPFPGTEGNSMTVSAFDVASAAELLLKARGQGSPVAVTAPEPADRTAARQVQEAVMAGLCDPGGVWKMALLGGVTREAAILPRALLHETGTRPILPGHAAIEVETALILDRDPGPRPTLDAIAEIRLAFEFVASRLRGNCAPLWKMADSFSSAGILMGEPIGGWRDGLPDRLGIALTIDGLPAAATETPAPISDALDFLGWLSRHAAAQGRRLKQGDVIITGARIGPVPLAGASRARAVALGASVSLD